MKNKYAVIIKGNPKYLSHPNIKLLAINFYDEIKSILEAKDYLVTFDDGMPMTSPDENVDVWIAHSRGIDRLEYAPSYIKTIELLTKEDCHNKSNDEIGLNPMHYQLSLVDILNLKNLP